MPIKVQTDLPAVEVLQQENIFVMDELRASAQDIRPLEVAIFNVMPTKIVTETQLLRMLSNTPLQVNITLLHPATHVSKNTALSHLDTFYKTFNEVRDKRFDGMIITGAPVELVDFNEVSYWDELKEILEWTKTNVFSTMHICWGAQAGLYYHYDVPKYVLPDKVFGVFKQKILKEYTPLFRGFDGQYFTPHSRHTECRRADVERVSELEILSESEECGLAILMAHNNRQIFCFGHNEYDTTTLELEYLRDVNKGLDIEVPANYYNNDDPKAGIDVKWKTSANLLFSNWLNHCVYQETPFDLNDLEPLK